MYELLKNDFLLFKSEELKSEVPFRAPIFSNYNFFYSVFLIFTFLRCTFAHRLELPSMPLTHFPF